MTDLIPANQSYFVQTVRKGIHDDTGIAWPEAVNALDSLVAALDAERARNRGLSEAFDRRGVELDVVLESREQIEAKVERLEAVAEAARAYISEPDRVFHGAEDLFEAVRRLDANEDTEEQ